MILLSSWGGCLIAYIKILVEVKRKTPVSRNIWITTFRGPEVIKGIIFKTFQGELRLETQQVLVRSDSRSNEKPKFDIDRGMYIQINYCQFLTHYLESKTSISPFLFLAIDLPPPPLFQDSVEKNIIPQVTIHSLLAKFDGKTTQVY